MAAATKVVVAARPLHASDSGVCHHSLKHQSLRSVRFSRMRIEGAMDCQDLRVRALDSVVGVLGGGQLGRMLCEAASTMGVKVAVLDPSKDCPASAVAHRHVVGSFRDASAVQEFAKGCGVLTIEIEHVDIETLDALASQGVDVQPSPNSIRIIQDKYLQKLHFRTLGIPLPDLLVVNDMETLKQAANVFGYPLMIKSRRLAYDGHGNAVVKNQDELYSAVLSLGGFERGLYVEKWALFEKELAVMVARGRDGELRCYPVVETTHRNNICYTVEAPAGVPESTQKAALEIAQTAVGSLEGAGVFAVELFLLAGGQVLLNEVAPRPHNSGHHTIEACYVSQFEQHLRAVLGLPLGDTAMKVSAAVMHNLLGENEGNGGMNVAHQTLERAFGIPGASVHWYDKREIRKQRKMGHITVVGASMDVVRARMHQITRSSGQNESPVLEGSDQSIDHSVAPIVGIIMGSDSDLHVMKHSAQVLESFGVPYEMKIVSAHRTADRMCEYAKNAHVEGLKVIIAGAGGAAHLPGMVGAITPLPAIGVPVKATPLDGLDSLLSIVQMPRGVPVATVAIDDATNAGLIAVRLLASSDKYLQQKIISRQGEMERMEMLKRLEAAGIHQTMNLVENGSPCVEESDHSEAPVVGIITSSHSDSRVMQDASEVLKSFGVPYERVLVSAEYVKNAHTKCLKVLIVVTDGAADLPDTVARVTPLLVIGVPRKVSSLNGLDSLVSVVQAAKGGPVAWVAIDNGTNAGLLAVRFLEYSDTRLLDKMISYQAEMERKVVENAKRLEALGWKQYIIQ